MNVVIFFSTHTALKMTTATKNGGQTTINLRPADDTAFLLKVTIRNVDNKSKKMECDRFGSLYNFRKMKVMSVCVLSEFAVSKKVTRVLLLS